MIQNVSRACFIVFISILPLMMLGQTAGVEKLDALSFRVPAGWDRVASPSHVSATIMSRDTYAFGTTQMHDSFSIHILSAHGSNLDAYSSLVQQRLSASAQHLVDFLKQRPVTGSGQKIDTKSIRVDVKKTTIGKVPAYEYVSHTAQIVANNPVPFQSRTLVSLYKDRYYEIAVGYSSARAAKTKPAADAFLASLHFE